MGSMLPSAVLSTNVERHGTKAFHIGVAEMNGWRNSMEDAHIIYLKEDWGFFGVFDGHGGDQCSAFVADRIRQKLDEQGCPKDDAEVKKLILGVDQDFLDTGQQSGSTAAMCIVHKPADGGKHILRVINAGDSRVILGRRDGTIVDGGGTEQGLTTDHKPGHPDERARIERCGGTVEVAAGGVHRVNGDLAVSRGFGDSSCKQTGGPGPEDRPVTANPEMGRFECDKADFLLIVCDGVSEGQFPNPEVVRFVAERLNEELDPGAAARAVCHKAVDTNSKDNITCMCILFSEWDESGKDKHEFIPGPLSNPDTSGFMGAYTAFANKAGLSLGQAVKMRYENILKELQSDSLQAGDKEKLEVERTHKIGEPPGAKGSAEYEAFFEEWEEKNKQNERSGGGQGDDMQMQLLRSFLAGQQTPPTGSGEFVRTPALAELKDAMDKHEALAWDERHELLATKTGEIIQKDARDGTTKVRFKEANIVAWLPTDILVPVDAENGTDVSI
mmetsp:Transcript_18548/g.30098  ORF Transcript_18548/g.30098 Transcript_18548/m.30098 type:complete len:501 (-) Transcript_18548:82-1584(-)